MSEIIELTQSIIELESRLHQPDFRCDSQAVDDLLHREFTEIGRSGNLFSRREVVESLQSESNRRVIQAENFSLSHISDVAVILTYQSFELTDGNVKVRCTLRSSVWVKAEQRGWQMRFHQGTQIKEVD